MSAINVDYNGLQPDVSKPSLAGEGLGVLAGLAFSNFAGQNLFGNSYMGNMGNSLADTFFSTLGKTAQQNISSGQNMLKGFGTDLKGSMASAGVGIASLALGTGITKAMGNSKLGRGVGAGVGTAASIYGGLAVTKALASKAASKALASGAASKAAGAASKAAGSINPYGAAMTIAGTALGAMNGPSKEYGGKYGNITKGMDMAYDAVMAGVNFVPVYGQIISGAMALNKGLSNLFGSTSGMTKADAFLGSAFTPAPIKWANMAGAKTTSTFNNQSWQNDEKTRSFMLDSFGDLLQRFDKAKQEAGKTYGTASHHTYKEAQRNINFANTAFEKILAMADQNELQNIKSQDMSTINNQRYAQNIQGGVKPKAFGKQGMKILNNSTNHNIGQRLLSAAALIDNKQMILSASGGTKLVKWTRVRKENGTYGYVRTNDEDKPIDFDEYSGKFKVYEQPSTDSKYTNATSASTKVSSEPTLGIQRTPDDHDAHIEEQKAIDKKVNLRTLTPGKFVGLMGANVPLAAAAVAVPTVGNAIMGGIVNPVSDYIGSTAAGQMITKGLSSPYFTKGLEASFAGHGLNHAINEGIDGYGDAAMTALELTPLGKLAKPIWNASKKGLQYTAKVADNTARYVSPSYDLYRTIGETPISKSSLQRTLTEDFGIFTGPKRITFFDTPYRQHIEGSTITKEPAILPEQYGWRLNDYGYPEVLGKDEKWHMYPRKVKGKLRDPLDSSIQVGRESVYQPTDYLYHFDNGNYQVYYDANGNPMLSRVQDATGDLGPIWWNKNSQWDIYNVNNVHPRVVRAPDYGSYRQAASYSQKGDPKAVLTGDYPLKDAEFLERDNLVGTMRRGIFAQQPTIKTVETPTIEWADATRASQITPENVASITPEQWTAAQDAAVARGDMAEAQRLRDLHADVNGYNSSLSLYHGSPKKFNEFKASPNIMGYTDYLSHFSVNPGTSSKFGDVRRFYTNIKNPLRVADQGAEWHPLNLANELGMQPKYVKDPLQPYLRKFQNIEGRGMYKEANRKFMEDELKGDAYVYDNTIEGGGDSYAIPVSRQVKLADAVTYDDKGVRIPLGKRDNFKLNDIRYSWLPWFLGGSTAATLNKSK